MGTSSNPDRGAERRLRALVQLREREHERARASFLEKRSEVSDLEAELSRLEERKRAVLRRGGPDVLEERALFEALSRIALDRRGKLGELRREAASLAERYLSARAQLDVARELEGRERRERSHVLARRADQAQCDAASGRSARDGGERKEEPCEEPAD